MRLQAHDADGTVVYTEDVAFPPEIPAAFSLDVSTRRDRAHGLPPRIEHYRLIGVQDGVAHYTLSE